MVCADDSQPKEKNNMAGKKRTTKQQSNYPHFTPDYRALAKGFQAASLEVYEDDQSLLNAAVKWMGFRAGSSNRV